MAQVCAGSEGVVVMTVVWLVMTAERVMESVGRVEAWERWCCGQTGWEATMGDCSQGV